MLSPQLTVLGDRRLRPKASYDSGDLHWESGSGNANCQVVLCTVVRNVENQDFAGPSNCFSVPLTLSANCRPLDEGVTLISRRVSPCRSLTSRKPPGEMLSIAAVS